MNYMLTRDKATLEIDDVILAILFSVFLLCFPSHFLALCSSSWQFKTLFNFEDFPRLPTIFVLSNSSMICFVLLSIFLFIFRWANPIAICLFHSSFFLSLSSQSFWFDFFCHCLNPIWMQYHRAPCASSRVFHVPQNRKIQSSAEGHQITCLLNVVYLLSHRLQYNCLSLSHSLPHSR